MAFSAEAQLSKLEGIYVRTACPSRLSLGAEFVRSIGRAGQSLSTGSSFGSLSPIISGGKAFGVCWCAGCRRSQGGEGTVQHDQGLLSDRRNPRSGASATMAARTREGVGAYWLGR